LIEPKYSKLVRLMESIAEVVLENNAEKSVDYYSAKEIIERLFGCYKYPIMVGLFLLSYCK
jgi:hypothetical protein